MKKPTKSPRKKNAFTPSLCNALTGRRFRTWFIAFVICYLYSEIRWYAEKLVNSEIHPTIMLLRLFVDFVIVYSANTDWKMYLQTCRLFAIAVLVMTYSALALNVSYLTLTIFEIEASDFDPFDKFICNERPSTLIFLADYATVFTIWYLLLSTSITRLETAKKTEPSEDEKNVKHRCSIQVNRKKRKSAPPLEDKVDDCPSPAEIRKKMAISCLKWFAK